MAKGQMRSNKEKKKPKADKSPPKPVNPNFEPMQTRTTVIIERGKKKDK